jgi:hypothetical protein
MSILKKSAFRILPILAMICIVPTYADQSNDGDVPPIVDPPFVTEKYRVADVTTLTEYQSFIEPIDIAIGNALPLRDGKVRLLKAVAMEMKWYFGPFKFPPDPKNQLAYPYNVPPARQDGMGRIVIDEPNYSALKPDGRGLLLLHELVEALYRLKFSDFSSYCKVIMEDPSIQTQCLQAWAHDSQDPYYQKISQLKFLNERDELSIESVTRWLFDNYKTMRPRDFFEHLAAEKFDTRIFNSHTFPLTTSAKSKSIGSDELAGIFDLDTQAKVFPSHCGFNNNFRTQANDSCDLQMNISENVLNLTIRTQKSYNGKNELSLTSDKVPPQLPLMLQWFRSGLNFSEIHLEMKSEDQKSETYDIRLLFGSGDNFQGLIIKKNPAPNGQNFLSSLIEPLSQTITQAPPSAFENAIHFIYSDSTAPIYQRELDFP